MWKDGYLWQLRTTCIRRHGGEVVTAAAIPSPSSYDSVLSTPPPLGCERLLNRFTRFGYAFIRMIPFLADLPSGFGTRPARSASPRPALPFRTPLAAAAAAAAVAAARPHLPAPYHRVRRRRRRRRPRGASPRSSCWNGRPSRSSRACPMTTSCTSATTIGWAGCCRTMSRWTAGGAPWWWASAARCRCPTSSPTCCANPRSTGCRARTARWGRGPGHCGGQVTAGARSLLAVGCCRSVNLAPAWVERSARPRAPHGTVRHGTIRYDTARLQQAAVHPSC
jgi:hypothetical protein